MEYTKRGEWLVKPFGITSQIYSGDYCVAAGIYNKRNAQLIASAPDLYEALKDLMFQFASAIEHPYSKDKEIYEKAGKALAKAEGK